MISLDEALEIVLSRRKDFGTETIALELAIGRVLKEQCFADRDFPPFDRVTMDGIAIDHAAARSRDYLEIEGVVAAGEARKKLRKAENCLEVMTGAICPLGCDTIIPYEKIKIEDGKAFIQEPLKKGANIHRKGEDRKQADLLIEPNILLSPAEIGVAASIGKAELLVAKLPKILIISSGDELVEIDQNPLEHQIRRDSTYRIASALKAIGLPVGLAHMNDQYEEIVRQLSDYLNHFDVLILSGGVSKGKFDFLPKAFEELGINKLFHRVAQRPGKPFWFGEYENSCTVFAFPGNPVSSFMCTQVYLMTWLRASFGLPAKNPARAVLQEDLTFKPDLDYFLDVKLTVSAEGVLHAQPFKGKGSGDFANLLRADAFLRLPRGREFFKKGELFAVYPFRQLDW